MTDTSRKRQQVDTTDFALSSAPIIIGGCAGTALAHFDKLSCF